jgi:hypothetical protein
MDRRTVLELPFAALAANVAAAGAFGSSSALASALSAEPVSVSGILLHCRSLQ